MKNISLKKCRFRFAPFVILAVFSFVFPSGSYAQQITWQQSWNYQWGRTVWKGIDTLGREVWGHDTNGDRVVDIYQFKSSSGQLLEMYDYDQNGVFDMWRNDQNGDGYFDTWQFDRNQDGRIDAQCSDSNQGRTWSYDQDGDGSLDSWFTDRNRDNVYEDQQWIDPQTRVLMRMMLQGAMAYLYVYANGPQADPTSVSYGQDLNGDGYIDSWSPYSGSYTPQSGSIPNNNSVVRNDNDCLRIAERARQLRGQIQTLASRGMSEELRKLYEELTILDQKLKQCRAMGQN